MPNPNRAPRKRKKKPSMKKAKRPQTRKRPQRRSLAQDTTELAVGGVFGLVAIDAISDIGADL